MGVERQTRKLRVTEKGDRRARSNPFQRETAEKGQSARNSQRLKMLRFQFITLLLLGGQTLKR